MWQSYRFLWSYILQDGVAQGIGLKVIRLRGNSTKDDNTTMKIRKIKYKNHPLLKDLELNLVNPDTNLPYDTIVFAGENGTGKTTILSTLNTFLCLYSFEYFERIEYEVDGKLYAAEPTGLGHDTSIGFHNRRDLQSNSVIKISRNRHNDIKGIEADNLDIRHYGSVYSKARADFSVKKISGTTSLEVDNSIYDQDDKEDFSSLKQLIIDLQSDDDADLHEQLEADANNFKYDAFKLTTKMYRFSKAFDGFFEKIKFKKVISQNGEKNVLFTKHNNEITIDNLSTGEKQIVYRGIYLLRNVGKLDGAAIMIDEPELSMHPQWQKRILQYFKDLFKTADGCQKAQLFFATHSEYVLCEALKDRDNTLIVVLKDNNGTIEKNEVQTPFVLPSITTSEINYAAFNVFSTDFHIALYGYLQTLTGKGKIEDCDNYIASSHLFIPDLHEFSSSYKTTNYRTLSTMIRNHIDHPDNEYSYTDEQLKTSTLLLIELIKEYKRNNT